MEFPVHTRIARPSLDLSRADRFWVEGLGMKVIYRHNAESAGKEHDLLMVGFPEADWHIELTHNPVEPLSPTPTPEDLRPLPRQTRAWRARRIP